MPLLSIIIPVYNAERTIARTLRSMDRVSIDSQAEVEVVIVNDGTPDTSMDVVRALLPKLAPIKVVVVEQQNKGLAGARNAGIDSCAGNYIFFLDADDELAVDPIPYIREHPDASALTFPIHYYRNGSREGTRKPRFISIQNHMDVFSAGNALTASSIIFKKDRIVAAFDESFRSLEDWLFWMMNPRIFEAMVIIPNIPSAFIHIHSKNMSSDYRRMGVYRQKAVELVTASYKAKLTKKQSNNFHIQSAIGAVFQGIYPSFRIFFRFPCNASLYAKFLIYTAMINNPARVSIYRK